MTAGVYVRPERIDVIQPDTGMHVFFREDTDLKVKENPVRGIAYGAERVLVIALDVDEEGTHVVHLEAGPGLSQAEWLRKAAAALELAAEGVDQVQDAR